MIKDLEGGSWRAEITDKIAVAITQSSGEHIPHKEAVGFILKKLSLMGVDPSNWMPVAFANSQN
ncbi:MAG: hypothetical protein IPN33_24125 [Saprospiraceae bacterium]|nr:hypothetical protein [Saprospiraceae bacterium]